MNINVLKQLNGRRAQGSFATRYLLILDARVSSSLSRSLDLHRIGGHSHSFATRTFSLSFSLSLSVGLSVFFLSRDEITLR